MTEQKTRRKFTKEFKVDVINQSNQCDNISQLAKDLGIRPELIYRWRSEHKDRPESSFPGNGNPKQTPHEKELARTKKALTTARMERDILKKAIGIFGRRNG